MVKRAFDIALQVFSAVSLAISIVEAEHEGKTDVAEQKKAAAIAKVTEWLKPILPDWSEPLVFPLLPMLVDFLVARANSLGFFGS